VLLFQAYESLHRHYGFSDHRQGIGPYEAETPLDALKMFIKESEALKARIAFNASIFFSSLLAHVTMRILMVLFAMGLQHERTRQ
jgi:hypothetical protein